MKYIFTLAAVVLISIAGYVYYQPDPTPQNGAARNSFIVEAVELKKLTIFDEIEALGTAFANEAVNITANSTDKIIEIRFDDGQQVKQNDIMVLLEQEEELAQKKAEEAQLSEHNRELKRLKDLLERNAAAKNEYDERKTLVAISQSKLEEIQARIDDKTIRAPFDGVLGLRKISVGSLVEPGDVITTIDDISQIKLDFSVPSTYLDVVQQGLVIQAKSDSLAEVFAGKITTVASRVDPRTRSVEVRAILPNPKGAIKPGVLLSVKLFRNEREALVVPEEAIIQTQDKHYVYKIEQNKVTKQQITKGKRAAGWVEILDGIEAGDIIMTRGQIRVKVGDEVKYEVKDYSLSGVQKQ